MFYFFMTFLLIMLFFIILIFYKLKQLPISTNEEVEEFNKRHHTQHSNNNGQIHCSKCGSVQIHSEKRGWRVTTGLIGSSQIMITCLQCGHKWKVGKV